MEKTSRVCSAELLEIGLVCQPLNSVTSPFQAIIADNGGNIYIHDFEQDIFNLVKSHDYNKIIKVGI